MMWKVTNDEKGKEEKTKEGMIYVLEIGEKIEIKIVIMGSINFIGSNT